MNYRIYRKVLYLIAIIIMLSFNLYSAPVASYSNGFLEDLKIINEEMDSVYDLGDDYYKLENKNSKHLNEELYYKYGLLVYGSSEELDGNIKDAGEYRYLGEDIRGQYVSNDLFRDDRKSNLDFAIFNWYEDPAREPEVIASNLIPNIWRQFNISQVFRSDELINSYLSTLSDMYKGKYMQDIGSVHWQKYMHVIALPTSKSRGLVVIFHKTSSGNIYYKDVRTKKLGEIGSKISITHTLEDGSSLPELKALDRDEVLLNGATFTADAPVIKGFEYKGYGVLEAYTKDSPSIVSTDSKVVYKLDYSFEKDTINIRFFYKKDEAEKPKEIDRSSLTGKIIVSSDEFDVSKWIPVDEKVKIRTEVSNAVLLEYSFKEEVQSVTYNVNVTYNYEDDDGKPRATSHTDSVSRDYKYYVIDELKLYIVDKVMVKNKSLKNFDSIYLSQEDLKTDLPEIDIVQHENHVVTNTNININYSEGESYKLDDYISFEVRNDRLTIGNSVFMDDRYSSAAIAPSSIDVLYPAIFEREYKIPKNIKNSKNSTTGKLVYKLIKEIKSKGSNFEVDISGNDVYQFTPTAINAEYKFESELDQRSDEDLNKDRIQSLPLNTIFKLNLDMTRKSGLETKRFSEKRTLSFPFAYYISENRSDLLADSIDTRFYKRKNSEVELSFDNDEYYVKPANWTPEGVANMKVVVYAKNHVAYAQKSAGELENSKDSESMAFKDKRVDVSGRIYDFTITKIQDPKWKKLFEQNYFFRSGKKDMNSSKIIEQTNVSSLPVMQGKNILAGYSNVPLSLGYPLEINIKTIGDYNYSNQAILLTPSYYVIDKKTGSRFEVDLYYRAKGGYLKLGSERDDYAYKEKFLSLNSSLNVGRYALTSKILERHEFPTNLVKRSFNSSNYTKYAHVPYKNFTKKGVIMRSRSRYFRGDLFMGYDVLKNINVPDEYNSDTVICSSQRWQSWFALPSTTVALKKSVDGSLDFIEGKSKFIDDGLLVVNFKVNLYRDYLASEKVVGVPRLSYENSNQNMWINEDSYGRKFDGIEFEYGDVLVYDLSSSSNDDIKRGRR